MKDENLERIRAKFDPFIKQLVHDSQGMSLDCALDATAEFYPALFFPGSNKKEWTLARVSIALTFMACVGRYISPGMTWPYCVAFDNIGNNWETEDFVGRLNGFGGIYKAGSARMRDYRCIVWSPNGEIADSELNDGWRVNAAGYCWNTSQSLDKTITKSWAAAYVLWRHLSESDTERVRELHKLADQHNALIESTPKNESRQW